MMSATGIFYFLCFFNFIFIIDNVAGDVPPSCQPFEDIEQDVAGAYQPIEDPENDCAMTSLYVQALGDFNDEAPLFPAYAFSDHTPEINNGTIQVVTGDNLALKVVYPPLDRSYPGPFVYCCAMGFQPLYSNVVEYESFDCYEGNN